MAVSSKSTPNYHVPPTQNTAPVLEFRCLYTHDLFKKQKKWHDGSLKFHTFNRRVMVYDDVKNFIGDLHYRQDEEFEEGLELQLDRPVKVEVGERIGQTQTDLAPLLDRGRGERNPKQATESSAPSRPLPRANTTRGVGRPRSLMDVLGTSQGRLGRARLPSQSPFDQFQAARRVACERPPAKKQKIAYGKENGSVDAVQPKNGNGAPNNKSTAKGDKVMMQLQINSPLPASPAIVELSSEDDTPQQYHPIRNNDRFSQKPSRQASISVEKQHKPRLVANASHVARIPRTTKAQNTYKHDEANKTGGRTLQECVTNALSHMSQLEEDVAAATKTHMSMTRLRLRNNTPRKKLMYKALLPRKICPSVPSSRSRSVELQDLPVDHDLSAPDILVSDDAMSPQSKRSTDMHVNPWPVEDGIEDEAEVNVPILHSSSPRSDGRRKGLNTILVSSSPMFLSQDTSLLSTHSQRTAQEESLAFMLSQTRDEARSSTYEHQQRDIEVKQNSLSTNAGLPSPTTSTASAHQSVDECEQDDIAISGLAGGETACRSDRIDRVGADIVRTSVPSSPSLPRHNTQTVVHCSPRSGATTNIAKNSVSGFTMTQSPLHANNVASSPVARIESSMKHTIQRAQSDSAAIAQMNMAPPITIRPSQLVQPKEDDQGAWTHLEAFLLFDKWPDSKAKDKPTFTHLQQQRVIEPDYEHDDYDGIDEDIQLSIDTSVRPNSRFARCGIGLGDNLPGIRSARAVLRDEF